LATQELFSTKAKKPSQIAEKPAPKNDYKKTGLSRFFILTKII
jgi:hypothetical protein